VVKAAGASPEARAAAGVRKEVACMPDHVKTSMRSDQPRDVQRTVTWSWLQTRGILTRIFAARERMRPDEACYVT
jgi:hypothetical protein